MVIKQYNVKCVNYCTLMIFMCLLIIVPSCIGYLIRITDESFNGTSRTIKCTSFRSMDSEQAIKINIKLLKYSAMNKLLGRFDRVV